MAKKRTLSYEQDMAANPRENVWVQANAGTGKTSVLVQRLLRILFRTSNDFGGGILCLTYTNAGAGEMRNRILAALREWACASDDELMDLLDGVSENRPATPDDILHAREIFFYFIDNPDVLKIKTIHGFCEEILHRFPVEAGLSPAWSLVSDDAQRILLQEAFEHLINTPSDDERVGAAFAHIVNRISEYSMPDLLSELSNQYKHFFGVENIVNYRKYFVETTFKFLELDKPVQTDVNRQKLEKIVTLAELEQKKRKTPAGYINDIINSVKQYIDNTIDFKEYKKVFLKADGTPIANVSKLEFLSDELARVYALNQYYENKVVFDDTVAMFDLSAAFAQTYREIKSMRNVLDFEDMILYTRKLFSNPETMGWVLSQLDLSLSHILVDEAQDTSPAQWDILRMLSGEFFVDGDTDKNPHSLFVVGDSKQSIYGFQGADSRAFALSRDAIATQIRENLRTIREIPLAQSFRSSPQVLYAVDAFFADDTVCEKTGFVNNPHKCFRQSANGAVELHKLVSKRGDETTVDGYVNRVATHIKSLIDNAIFKPSDIMVLVQNRYPMAPKLVRELKRLSIDVAGSDRIVLPNFPAVRDLLNLVRFCLNPADDFSLCCVLRSPFYRLNERDILNLCKIKNDENKARKNASPDFVPMTVFEALENSHPEIYTDLGQVLEWSKTMSPYSFFDAFLNHNDMRSKMISALGDQVIDPLEEFMTICLAYERTMPGTLKQFLKYFITGNSQIKRDMDASNGVRIVTVHGSKGLEAPAVFLIDTVNTPDSEKLLPVPTSNDINMPVWLWSPRANNSARRAVAAAALMDTRVAEYYRLLYVAMTRARDNLYIYGFTNNTASPEISWHNQLWRVFDVLPNTEKTDEVIRITNVK
ncbi:MAG: UvrD-helicase domain-containing protein [Alphaproteobacteria bacterium]|nr:UvrD-helicase domain-containing protein [Alphaproteobacteria bacterium]